LANPVDPPLEEIVVVIGELGWGYSGEYEIL